MDRFKKSDAFEAELIEDDDDDDDIDLKNYSFVDSQDFLLSEDDKYPTKKKAGSKYHEAYPVVLQKEFRDYKKPKLSKSIIID